MPEISRFFGVGIYIYFTDHPEPHFHARYNGKWAKISIDNLSVISGAIPATALKMVVEWASLHRSELLDAWNQAVAGVRPNKIPPLE
jgi:hypothetical protein